MALMNIDILSRTDTIQPNLIITFEGFIILEKYLEGYV